MTDKRGNRWQYHPRSDRHSKVACWAITLDLLITSPVLRRHVEDGKVVFGVNHEMNDFRTRRKKDLDLVIARPGTREQGGRSRTFAELGEHFGVILSDDERAALEGAPLFEEGPVGSVLLALEAKACMTAHQRARPRLYDELNSSHLTTHGASDQAIAAGFVMLNHADRFVSPDLNKRADALASPELEINVHRQPRDVEIVNEKVRELPRRGRPGEEGYDAIGIVVVDCVNDGSPVSLVSDPPAPDLRDPFHYDAMIRRIVHQYDTLFATL